jgi:TonB family protein
MYAAGRLRAGRRVGQLMAALMLAGCASDGAPPAVDPSLIEKSEPGNTERPDFFVQWRSGQLPGLTQRPSIDPSNRLPKYPNAALREEAAGTTTLETCITADGKLVDIHIANSSGNLSLDEATLEWAKNAKYKPAMFNGEAFAVCGYKLDWVWQFTAPE